MPKNAENTNPEAGTAEVMMTAENTNPEVAATDLVVAEPTYSKGSLALPVSLADDITPDNITQIAQSMLDATPINFDVSNKTWTPVSIGETKRLMFAGSEVIPLPSKDPERKGEIDYVPFVNFFEPYLNAKQEPAIRTVKMSCADVVDAFLIIEGDKTDPGRRIVAHRKSLKSKWKITYSNNRQSAVNPARTIKCFTIEIL